MPDNLNSPNEGQSNSLSDHSHPQPQPQPQSDLSKSKSKLNWSSKPVEVLYNNFKPFRTFDSMSEAATHLNVHPITVKRYIENKGLFRGQYYFTYLNNETAVDNSTKTTKTNTNTNTNTNTYADLLEVDRGYVFRGTRRLVENALEDRDICSRSLNLFFPTHEKQTLSEYKEQIDKMEGNKFSFFKKENEGKSFLEDPRKRYREKFTGSGRKGNRSDVSEFFLKDSPDGKGFFYKDLFELKKGPGDGLPYYCPREGLPSYILNNGCSQRRIRIQNLLQQEPEPSVESQILKYHDQCSTQIQRLVEQEQSEQGLADTADRAITIEGNESSEEDINDVNDEEELQRLADKRKRRKTK